MMLAKAAAGLLLLLLPSVLAGSASVVGLSSPLLLWSNSRGLVGKGHGPQVSYQVLASSDEFAGSALLKAAGKGTGLDGLLSSVSEDTTVVAFLGSQLDAADLRKGSGAIQQLGSILDAAASSLVMPYSTSKAASLRESLVNKLVAAGVSHQAIGCSASVLDLGADVSAKLAAAEVDSVQLLVVCAAADAADATSAALENEVAQLKAVQAALEASGRSYLVMYASLPAQPSSELQGRRRSLLQVSSGFGPYTVCGPLCQTQVRWLEGMLAMLVLALASCAGLVCLYVLDTPTRFDAPKENAQ